MDPRNTIWYTTFIDKKQKTEHAILVTLAAQAKKELKEKGVDNEEAYKLIEKKRYIRYVKDIKNIFLCLHENKMLNTSTIRSIDTHLLINNQSMRKYKLGKGINFVEKLNFLFKDPFFLKSLELFPDEKKFDFKDTNPQNILCCSAIKNPFFLEPMLFFLNHLDENKSFQTEDLVQITNFFYGINIDNISDSIINLKNMKTVLAKTHVSESLFLQLKKMFNDSKAELQKNYYDAYIKVHPEEQKHINNIIKMRQSEELDHFNVYSKVRVARSRHLLLAKKEMGKHTEEKLLPQLPFKPKQSM